MKVFFPYGHVPDWDSPKYRCGDIASLPTHSHSSIVDPNFQYQPLSRMHGEVDLNKVGEKSNRGQVFSGKSDRVRSGGTKGNSQNFLDDGRSRIVSPVESLKNKEHGGTNTKRRSILDESSRGKTEKKFPKHSDIYPQRHRVSPGKEPPLSFYPVDPKKSIKEGTLNPATQTKAQRLVIDISEEMKAESEKKQTNSGTKRKSIGNLLEMKIQGLKKQKLEQITDGDKTTISNSDISSKTSTATTTFSSAGTTTTCKSKSITSIINTLTANARMEEKIAPKAISSMPARTTDTGKPKHSSSNPLFLSHQLDNFEGEIALDNRYAENLTKCANQSEKLSQNPSKETSYGKRNSYKPQNNVPKLQERHSTDDSAELDEPLLISNVKSEARPKVNSSSPNTCKDFERAAPASGSPRFSTLNFCNPAVQVSPSSNAEKPVANTTKSTRTAKSLNLDNIAKNLSKSIERGKGNKSVSSPENVTVSGPILPLTECTAASVTKPVVITSKSQSTNDESGKAPVSFESLVTSRTSLSKSPQKDQPYSSEIVDHSCLSDSVIIDKRKSSKIGLTGAKITKSSSIDSISSTTYFDRKSGTSEASTPSDKSTRQTRTRNFRCNMSERALTEKNVFDNFGQIAATGRIKKSASVGDRLNAIEQNSPCDSAQNLSNREPHNLKIVDTRLNNASDPPLLSESRHLGKTGHSLQNKESKLPLKKYDIEHKSPSVDSRLVESLDKLVTDKSQNKDSKEKSETSDIDETETK